MKVIGLVGGVASGKSRVAAELIRLGAAGVDADQLAHDVLELPQVQTEIRARWGEHVFEAPGKVNRRALAQSVFGDSPEAKQARAALERIVHPHITARMQVVVGECRTRGCPAVVLDAPLLLEAGWDQWCDEVWFVEVSAANRSLRAQARGWSEAEWQAREAAQVTIDLKRQRANQIIDNNGSLDALRAQLTPLWQSCVGSVP